jgi:hypothetical protein
LRKNWTLRLTVTASSSIPSSDKTMPYSAVSARVMITGPLIVPPARSCRFSYPTRTRA